MKILLSILLILVPMCLSGCGASNRSPISIKNAWVQPAIMDDGSTGIDDGYDIDGPVSAAYMMIRNRAGVADRLISAKSDSAETLEIHLSEMKGGMMTLRLVEGGLEIPAKSQVELKPGSYHIMLIDVRQDFIVGDKIRLTLLFENAGEVKTQADVKNP